MQKQIKVYEILKNDQKLLKKYENLKSSLNGKSFKKYQTKKYEFYNRILHPHKILNNKIKAILFDMVGVLIFGKDNDDKGSLQKLSPSANITTSATATPETVTASPSGKTMDNVTDLQIIDEKVGTGEVATAGKSVSVNYTGTLTNGTVFDSNIIASYGHVEPFTFTLGAGQVIQGWDKGVVGMKIGGKRKLIIPSSMAYGDNGVPGAIPGGAALVFEVELLKVQ